MQSHSFRQIAFALVSGVVLSVISPVAAAAQEQVTPNLVLKKTYMKSTTSQLMLDVAERALFTPTIVNCGTLNPCTLRVELATFIFNAAGVASARLRVDGQLVASTYFDYNVTPSQGGARTFTWLVDGLAPGQHTIEVRLFRDAPAGDSSQVQDRTLTVSVFKR